MLAAGRNSLSKGSFLEQRELILWRARRPPAMSPLGVEQHSKLGEQFAIEPLPNADAIFGHFRLGQVRFVLLIYFLEKVVSSALGSLSFN